MRKRPWLAPVLCGLMLWLAASPAASRAQKAVRRLPQGAQLTLTHEDEFYGDRRVGAYVSSTWGFSTVSCFIEGPTGLILIDTQFLPSAAEELVRWAEQATGKKVAPAAGLKIKAHVLDPGCSEAHVVVELDGHIIPGDLVASGSHSWLEIGRTAEWRRQAAKPQGAPPSPSR